MTELSLSRRTAAARPSAISTAFHWLAVAKSRRDLSTLDPRALADIGISPEQAEAEAARPMWDAPSRWVKS